MKAKKKKKKYGVYRQWNIIQPLKEWNYDTCYNINEAWRHRTKWDKPDTKGQILWFHLHGGT